MVKIKNFAEILDDEFKTVLIEGGRWRLVFTKYQLNVHNIMDRSDDWIDTVDNFFHSINL